MKHFETKAYKKAQELGKESTEEDLQKIDSSIGGMKKGLVAKIWDKVLFLWEKVKSPEIPLRLKLTIAGALLYLILPADVIPDALPGIGFLDDVSVILLVFKEVSRYAIPKAVEFTKTKLQESYYEKIDFKLKEIFYNKLLNSSISFVINIAGIAIILLKPVGEYSKYIAAAIFSVNFIYMLVRFLLYIKQYGRPTWGIIKLVLKEKSLSKGISLFIQQEYPLITSIYAGINIAQKFVPGLDSIPDFDKIVNDFILHFRKRIILVSLLFALYSVVIFVVKVLVSA